VKPSIETNPLRVLAVACMIAIGFCFVAAFYWSNVSDKGAANKDFISYWAAGKQLIHGANPYDGTEILQLERSAGLEGSTPLIMRNPPTALFLALPLGFAGAKWGLILWSLVLLGGLSVANWIVWMLNGRPDNRLHLLGYLFAPALACQLAGQVGTLLLVGVMLFFRFHKTRPYLAGAALLLCVVKPHLFLPFFLVLALWSFHRRECRVLVGFGVTMLANGVFLAFIDAHAWSQYSEMMRAVGVLNEFIPTLSMSLRLLIDPRAVWLQFLPEVCGCVWAVWYFWTRRDRWSWSEQGMLVLLVSVICVPYAWFSDEAILLPAIMAGLFRAVARGRTAIPLALFGAAALFEVCVMVKMTTPYYLWTVPAWLAWYLYATSRGRTSSGHGPSQKELSRQSTSEI
jgi:hypothetical protein